MRIQSSMKTVSKNVAAEDPSHFGGPQSLWLLSRPEPSIRLPVALQVKGLSKSYNRTKAVVDLTFDVGEGEVFGLLGPNGTGKSTTVVVHEAVRASHIEAVVIK
jgi:ATPase subunit of ABC transporter with duplicated ATPase domains